MPQLDIGTYLPQVVWLVITFAALFLVMARIVVPRIGGVLEARRRRIEDNLDRATELKKEAEAALAAYDKAIAEARTQAQAIVAEAKAALAAERATREAETARVLAARIDEAEGRIAAALATALASMRDVAVDVAATAVERLLGERPTDDAVAAAVAAAIGDRGAKA